MTRATTDIRHQVAYLALDELEERLDWDKFLEALPEGIGDDELIQELVELLQGKPKVGEDFMNVSQELYDAYVTRVHEIIDLLLADDESGV